MIGQQIHRPCVQQLGRYSLDNMEEYDGHPLRYAKSLRPFDAFYKLLSSRDL